eukprot:CAMPEP_0117653112 /NCGR_PEP_ID=MMETSP0804-20121206/3012_1 /TAXON_ID=1074897 /ORGANISM="Tetraselmis astigmatica, Strain CCMP880" /LENGTH=370 /DNA_ID=CAMNT_0005459255 /DNA_START=817 /DNA_END=1929 /DNA_ORIENTATION=+
MSCAHLPPAKGDLARPVWPPRLCWCLLSSHSAGPGLRLGSGICLEGERLLSLGCSGGAYYAAPQTYRRPAGLGGGAPAPYLARQGTRPRRQMGGRGPSHTLVGVVAPVEAPASADIRLDLTCQCPIPAVEEPGGPWVPPSWAGPRGVGPDAARHGGPPRAQRPPRKHPSPNYLAPPPPCRAGTPLSATGGPHGAHPCHVGWGPVSHDPQGVPLQTSSARAGLLLLGTSQVTTTTTPSPEVVPMCPVLPPCVPSMQSAIPLFPIVQRSTTTATPPSQPAPSGSICAVIMLKEVADVGTKKSSSCTGLLYDEGRLRWGSTACGFIRSFSSSLRKWWSLEKASSFMMAEGPVETARSGKRDGEHSSRDDRQLA